MLFGGSDVFRQKLIQIVQILLHFAVVHFALRHKCVSLSVYSYVNSLLLLLEPVNVLVVQFKVQVS